MPEYPDAPGTFADTVQSKLLTLYRKMVGPDVSDAQHVEWNAFEAVIRVCVSCFWSRSTGTAWAWRSKKLEPEEALALIETEVRPALTRAATMKDLKARYLQDAQAAFDALEQYVRDYKPHTPDTPPAPAAHSKPAEASGADRLQTLLREVLSLVDKYQH